MRLSQRILESMRGVAQGVAGAGLALAVGCSAAGDVRPPSVDPIAHPSARLIPVPFAPPASPPAPVVVAAGPPVAVAAAPPVEDLRDEAAGRRKREARQRAVILQHQAQQQPIYVGAMVYCGRG